MAGSRLSAGSMHVLSRPVPLAAATREHAVDSGGAVIIPARGVPSPATAAADMVVSGPRRHGNFTPRQALVIGGSGMLAACASTLVADGYLRREGVYGAEFGRGA